LARLKEKNNVSENLIEEQRRTLNVLLNLIIPPSKDGKMPSAADVGFFDYLDSNKQMPWLKEGLQKIVVESLNKYGKEFSVLNGSEQTQLIHSIKRLYRKFFNRLTTQVMQCYYQNDDVLEAIGLETRPPFPKGYLLEEGDITLLEPVYLRGKIYRD
jgi:hypothetical protein